MLWPSKLIATAGRSVRSFAWLLFQKFVSCCCGKFSPVSHPCWRPTRTVAAPHAVRLRTRRVLLPTDRPIERPIGGRHHAHDMTPDNHRPTLSACYLDQLISFWSFSTLRNLEKKAFATGQHGARDSLCYLWHAGRSSLHGMWLGGLLLRRMPADVLARPSSALQDVPPLPSLSSIV
jgi:hypothetical protein